MFCQNSLKLSRSNCSARNAKSKGGRAKNSMYIALLTAMRAVWGNWSGGCGFNHLLDV